MWLLRLLPMWDYICPRCSRQVSRNSHECPHCREHYPMPLRVPPKIWKDPKALEDYVHKYIFQKVSPEHREYLTQFFTEIFSDGFESGDFSAWTGNVQTGGTNTVISGGHHGSYSFQSTITSNADLYIYKSFTRANRQLNFRAYFKKTSTVTGSPNYFMHARDYTGSQSLFYLGETGSSRNLYLRYHDSGGAKYKTSSITFPTDGNWHCFEVQFKPSSSVGEYRVFLDDSEVTDLATTGLNANYQSDRVYLGAHCPGGEGSSGTMVFDCVVVADTYSGLEEQIILKTVMDTFSVSDSVLRNKPSLTVTDAIGASGLAFRNKPLLTITDALALAETIKTLKTLVITEQVQLTDSADTIKSGVLKFVENSVGLADSVLLNKFLQISDSITLWDATSIPSRILKVIDVMSLADDAFIDKVLVITENVSLAEVIQVGVGGAKKIRLFLILGDLAVQLTGD